MHQAIAALKGGLVVSSQAGEGEPLNRPAHICAMALSGLAGGAVGLRLEGLENIEYVRARTQVPIIGLLKSHEGVGVHTLDKVYITASFAEAVNVLKRGADIVAIDGTSRPRPDGLTLEQTIRRIHDLDKPVWADCSTLDEGLNAAACGADVVSTTLYGYTRATELPETAPPDFALLEALIKQVSVPVVLEGRLWHTHEVTRAFELGAHAVVVGSAITRPQLITRRFVSAIPSRAST